MAWRRRSMPNWKAPTGRPPRRRGSSVVCWAQRRLKLLSRLQPLVIDKVDNLNVKPEQANAFFRLIDQRYNRVSTIITTSLDLTDWYELFEKKHLVDALLDRLRHRCITISIDGPSLRSPETQASTSPGEKARQAARQHGRRGTVKGVGVGAQS